MLSSSCAVSGARSLLALLYFRVFCAEYRSTCRGHGHPMGLQHSQYVSLFLLKLTLTPGKLLNS